MSYLPVIVEDQTLRGFRPLAWSVPVCELRCGLVNGRERVAAVTGREPALLVRGMLQGLAGAGGYVSGTDGVAASGEDVLLLSARLGFHWDLLDRVHQEAQAGPVAWRDGEGWLAVSVPADGVEAAMEAWRRWDAAADDTGCWRDPGAALPVFEPPVTTEAATIDGALSRIWDIVPATAAAISADLQRLGGRLPARRAWGAVPEGEAAWARATDLAPLDVAAWAGVTVRGEAPVLAGGDIDLAPGTVIDAKAGPVVLGRGVRVLPHSYLEGPLYIGNDSLVKAGTTIYGETSLGAVCKVAGEIGESTFLDFVNKQHEGFIGHAYLGSWCNLGALTTCSDLKNTYGNIRVDLGHGAEDSGRRFVGLLMGEHGKTAIGTMFNTGTTVGFSSNVFSSGFPDKCLPCYTWGDGSGTERQDHARALATAATVMTRRGCRCTPGHDEVFRALAG